MHWVHLVSTLCTCLGVGPSSETWAASQGLHPWRKLSFSQHPSRSNSSSGWGGTQNPSPIHGGIFMPWIVGSLSCALSWPLWIHLFSSMVTSSNTVYYRRPLLLLIFLPPLLWSSLSLGEGGVIWVLCLVLSTSKSLFWVLTSVCVCGGVLVNWPLGFSVVVLRQRPELQGKGWASWRWHRSFSM